MSYLSVTKEPHPQPVGFFHAPTVANGFNLKNPQLTGRTRDKPAGARQRLPSVSGGPTIAWPGDSCGRPIRSLWAIPGGSTCEGFTKRLQVVADFDTLPVVHRQQLQGRAASRGSTDNLSSMPSKVFCPAVSTWMKQGHKLSAFRIKTGDVRSLVEIAKAARESQVIRFGRTTVLTSDDMLDVEACEPRSCLRQSAVFA